MKKAKTKTRAKRSTSSKTTSKQSFGAGLRRTSKKIVDQMLVKVSPQLQDKIDHLIKTLESSRSGKIGDLSLMAGKILVRAQEVSRGLRASKKGRKG